MYFAEHINYESEWVRVNNLIMYLLKIYYLIRFFFNFKNKSCKNRKSSGQKMDTICLSTYPLDSRALTLLKPFAGEKKSFFFRERKKEAKQI